MWRSLFLAIGMFMMFLGIAFLGVERVELRMREQPSPSALSIPGMAPQEGARKEIAPAPWWPWSFLSGGAVVCLYSFTIPRRVQGK